MEDHLRATRRVPSFAVKAALRQMAMEPTPLDIPIEYEEPSDVRSIDTELRESIALRFGEAPCAWLSEPLGPAVHVYRPSVPQVTIARREQPVIPATPTPKAAAPTLAIVLMACIVVTLSSTFTALAVATDLV
jgi:hypothetical protein